MAGSALELDFFRVQKNTPKTPIFERHRSFRDIQGVVSKINPEILKSVIANASVPNTQESQKMQLPLPVCDPTLRLSCGLHKTVETAPMTIFYNGSVTVFNVSPHTARDILKLAEGAVPKSVEPSDSNPYLYDKNLLESLNADLPITRKISLGRFLEKRKERLAMVSPYDSPTNSSYCCAQTVKY